MHPLSALLFRLEVGVRWTARVLTTLLVGLVLVIFIGEGGFKPLKLRGVEKIQMAFFCAAVIGMMVAWRWQVIGGALALGAMILFYLVEGAVTRGLPKGLVLYLMLVPGMLF